MATAYRKQIMKVKLSLVKPAALLAICWLYSTTLVLAGDVAFQRGLLWKVQREGTPPSYVFGTMHSEDAAVLSLPAEVRGAFAAADALTLEVVLDTDSLLLISTAFMYTDGSSLESRLDTQLYRRVVEALGKRDVPELVVASMKPWAVAVTLMMPPAQTGVVLDLMLYQQALQAGKPVSGLETPLEQLAVFEDLSAADQRALLQEALDNLDTAGSQLEALKQAYLARDLQRMVELSNTSMAGQDQQLVERVNRSLITERNLRMAQSMQAQLQAGNRFIAIGALHLPGEQGVLQLLSQQGYSLSCLY
jgi:uncharacterized protein YbaP (TraB family)